MKKQLLYTAAILMMANVVVSYKANASAPEGYYDRLEGLSGVQLKKAVKNVAKNHTAVSYGDDTWDAFRTTDTHYINGQLVWWDMYSNDNVSVASGHPGLNIEHSVANSWWGGTKNDAYKDLFHLNPSNSEANNRKSNYPLSEISSQTWNNGVTFVGKPKSGQGGGAQYVYEPADQYKGDFARVFFYMFTIYDDIAWKEQWNWMFDTSSDYLLKPWAYELLLRWAAEDPVSQKEIDRNEAIYKIQKNRNPFIDNPLLAEHIWGSKNKEPFHADGSYEPGPDPDPDPEIPVDPTPDPGPTPSGYWYAVTSAGDLNEKDMYVLLDVDENIAMSYNLGSSSKYFETCGRSCTVETVSGQKRLSSVPDDIAVMRLSPETGGWKIKVSDAKGNFKGYLRSTTAKDISYTPALNDDGTLVQITVTSANTDLSFGSKAGKLEYNTAAPRFTTYTSNQGKVQFYRMEVELPTTGLSTGFEEEPAVIGIYDINGRKMNTTDMNDLDHGIYIVVSNMGSRKIIR